MFNRVRDSLVYPKLILNYRKDHILFVLFYLFFFAVLLSSRTVIEVVKYDGLENVYKAEIEEEMTIINQDCEILNAELVCDGDYIIRLYEELMFVFYLDSNESLNFSDYPNDKYTLIIHDDQMYFYVFGINTLTLPLTELPYSLQNIDFDDQVNDSTVFYNNLFGGIDDLLIGYKNYWGPTMIVFEIGISFAFFLVFVLVSAWFLKMRYKVIPFKETFTLTTYSSTSLFIILTFYSMLELSLLIVVILLVLSFRQNSIMSREIDRRLEKKS
ncbi:MAG: DUF1189 family protein [Candidatus Izimaplasma sp.]|nr:DUF1189 family protein [Candidatus Izimaplasma bacterium]